MAHYVDGFVIPIKKKNVKNYKKMASIGCKVWMDHGALDYYETVFEEDGMHVSIPFAKLCKLKPGESVVFAFIIYKSKAHRNAVNKKVMKDPRMSPEQFQDMEMPFDMKRFTAGGFSTLVRAKKKKQ